MWSVQDGLDPDTTLMAKQTTDVPLAGLLGQVIVIVGDRELTVKDVITHGANVAGAIHAGSPKTPEHEAISEFAENFNIGGYQGGIRDLQAIGRVTVKGLAPLRDAVKAGQGLE
jgi:hypothetical protein